MFPGALIWKQWELPTFSVSRVSYHMQMVRLGTCSGAVLVIQILFQCCPPQHQQFIPFLGALLLGEELNTWPLCIPLVLLMTSIFFSPHGRGSSWFFLPCAEVILFSLLLWFLAWFYPVPINMFPGPHLHNTVQGEAVLLTWKGVKW